MYHTYLIDPYGVVIRVLARITAMNKALALKKLVSMYRETKGMFHVSHEEYAVGDTVKEGFRSILAGSDCLS